MGLTKSRDSELSNKNKRGVKVLQQHIAPSVVDEELHDDEKPFPTPLKGKPTTLRGLSQVDMHTFSQAGSAKDNNNKVLEEKSPRGSKGSIKVSSKNVPGFFTDTMKQRDSFPPYDAMGSEKNASAR